MENNLLNPDYIQQSLVYVTTVPYFWQSMGMIGAVAMIVTVLLFDYNFKFIFRTFLAKFIFVLLLLYVTYARLVYSIEIGVTNLQINSAAPLAGMVTLSLVSFFWFMGIFLGMLIIYIRRRRSKVDLPPD